MSIEAIDMGGIIDEIDSLVEFQFILNIKWFEGRMNFLICQEEKITLIMKKWSCCGHQK